MTDKPDALPITDPHHVIPEFVNGVIGSGQLNGIFNITFGTLLFTPTADSKVDPDMVVSVRLRMDFSCLQQLHATLGALIEQNIKPANGTTH
jgi:hypothetical protein